MSATAKGRLDLSRLGSKNSLREIEAEAKRDQVIEIWPDEIEAPKQVRTVFTEIEALRATIDSDGQDNPVTIGPKNASGKYPLLKGGRRLRACKLEPVIKIRAIIKVDAASVPADKAILSQIIENDQRENLLPHEIGQGYRDAQIAAKERGEKLTGRDIAKYVGKREEYVSLHLSLADIPESLATLIEKGVSKDATVLSTMRALYDKDKAIYEAVLADAMANNSLERATVRDALKRAKGIPETPPATTPGSTKSQLNGAAPQVAPAQPATPPAGIATADNTGGETQGEMPKGLDAASQPKAANGGSEAFNPPGATPSTDEKFVHAQTSGGGQATQVTDHAAPGLTKTAAKHFEEAHPEDLIIFVRVTFDDHIRTGKLVTRGASKADSSRAFVTVVDGEGNTTTEYVHVDDIQIVSISKRS